MDNSAWEYHKETIRELYLVKNKKVKQVMQEMENGYKFKADTKQYGNWFRKWKFRKNLTEKEWVAVARQIHKRKICGKENSVMVDGISMPYHKVQKAISRYGQEMRGTTWDKLKRKHETGESPCDQTLQGVVVCTPPSFQAEQYLETSKTRVLNGSALPWLKLQQLFKPEVLYASLYDSLLENICTPRDFLADLGLKELRDALVLLESGHSSSSTVEFPNVTHFANMVLIASNRLEQQTTSNENGLDAIKTLAQTIIEGFKCPRVAPMLIRLLGSSKPILEALFEIVFREAILSEDIAVVKTIAKHSTIDLDGPLPEPWIAKGKLTHRWSCLPLEAAIKLKSAPLVQVLLKAGASAGSINDFGQTITSVAVQEGTKEILEILLNTGEGDLSSAFMSLVHKGYLSYVEELLSQGLNRDREALNCQEEYDEGKTALIYATDSGNFRMARMLLVAGADVNGCDKFCQTAIHYAAYNSDIDLAKLLLQCGAKTERMDRKGNWPWLPNDFYLATPLQIASYHGDLPMVRLLLNFGAGVNAAASRYKTRDNYWRLPLQEPLSGGSALLLAVLSKNGPNYELIDLLLQHGAAVNVSPSSPRLYSALEEAVYLEDHVLVQVLLGAGAEYSIPLPWLPGRSTSVIHAAAKIGDLKLLKASLFAGTQINCLNSLSQTAVTITILSKNMDVHAKIDIISFLIKNGADINHPGARPSALEAAIDVESVEMINLLSTRGAIYHDSGALASAVRTKNYEMVEKMLADASRHSEGHLKASRQCFGHKALFTAVVNSDQEMVEKLLNSGLNVNPECQTQALWYACGGQSLPLIRHLLSIGASPNPKVSTGELFECKELDDEVKSLIKKYPTPLWMAIKNQNEDAALLLLGNKADMHRCASSAYSRDTRTYYSETVLSFAIRHSQLKIFNRLLQSNVDVNQPASTKFMRTALQEAAECGSFDIVNRLLQAGADVHQAPANNKGVTALQAAATGGFLGIASKFLDLGANVNARGSEKDGKTALVGAAEHGRISMVQLLLDAGADVSSAPFGIEQYATAVELARENGHTSVARLLIRHRESLG